MGSKRPPLPILWPERIEQLRHLDREEGLPWLPSWDQLKEEERTMRERIDLGQMEWPIKVEGEISPWWSDAPPRFDINYPQAFLLLPSVVRFMNAVEKRLEDLRRRFGQLPRVMTTGDHLFVELYTEYCLSRWNAFGKQVYVVDPDTFELLANTELPNMPTRMLTAPKAAFYLKFPEQSYIFDVGELDPTPQEVEGVLVSFTGLSPDEENRQLVFLVVGKSGKHSADDHCIYFNYRLDDTPIRGIPRPAAGTALREGGHEVGVLTPTALANFCLYMMSEHPHLEPVPAPPRLDLSRVKSKAKLRKKSHRDRQTSRLGYIYVGRALRQPELSRSRPEGPARYRLDHQVWVSGHWRWQPHGTHRSQRKLIWIKPYLKGPDLSIQEEIRAARVQPAQRRKRWE